MHRERPKPVCQCQVNLILVNVYISMDIDLHGRVNDVVVCSTQGTPLLVILYRTFLACKLMLKSTRPLSSQTACAPSIYEIYYTKINVSSAFISSMLTTVWRIIFVGSNFRGKSEKALKINFRGFKFRDSNQSRGMALLHKR